MGGEDSPTSPPIPAEVRKTIQTIKEIVGSHSEEEIYATLKDSSMDPNETAQKLLSQDHFHEVRRKRDKKKESMTAKDYANTRMRSGIQGRGGRGATTDRGVNQRNYLQHTYASPMTVGIHTVRDAKDTQKAQRVLDTPAPQLLTQQSNCAYTESISSANTQQSQMLRESWSAIAQGKTSSDMGHGVSSKVTKSSNLVTVSAPSYRSVQEEGSNTLQQFSISPKETSVEHHSLSNQELSLGLPFENSSQTNKKTTNCETKSDNIWISHSSSCIVRDDYSESHVESPGVAEPSQNAGVVCNDRQHEQQHIGWQKGLNIKDERRVIIPDHLQVCEAGCEGLTFGSFRTCLSTAAFEPTQDAELNLQKSSQSITEEAVSIQEESDNLGSGHSHQEKPDNLGSGHSHQHPPALVAQEGDVKNDDLKSCVSISPSRNSHSELDTVDAVTSSGSVYVETVLSRSNGGSMTQDVEGQSYNQIGLQREDIPSPQNLLTGYDPSPYVYSPFSRPNSDKGPQVSSLSSSSAYSFYHDHHQALLSNENVSSRQEVHVRQNSEGVNHPIPSFQESAPVISQPVTSSVHVPSDVGAYQQYFSPFYGSTSIHGFPGNLRYSNNQSSSMSNLASSSSYHQATPINYMFSPYNSGLPNGSLHNNISSAYGGYSSPAGFSDAASNSGTNAIRYDVSRSQFRESDVFVPRNQIESLAIWNSLADGDNSGIQQSYYTMSSQARHSANEISQGFSSLFKPFQSLHGGLPLSQGQATYAARYQSSQGGVLPNSSHLRHHSGALGGYDNSSSDISVYQQQQNRFWTNAL
eukprot:TRINITY_DN9108_c0_g1_i2.p1 TRINITY_DN9108_c0_g1~~TRINITY_DN9108_c0_g1_i2.p1  ORF type:complete len:807 (+),score=159.11 TRINITY_DN9108_c0_g1_i2:532-2952(+)